MTIKGIYKLAKQPHIFAKDYLKKRFNKDELKIYVAKAIDIDIPSDRYYYFIYKELNKEKYFSRAEVALRKAILIKPKSQYYYELSELLKRKFLWWQVVDTLKVAIELSEPNVKKEWYFSYVLALENMNFLDEASLVLNKMDKLGYLDYMWYFKYGNILQQNNELNKAKIIFKKAIDLHPNKNNKQFGIGLFYQESGDWSIANKYYTQLIKQDNKNVNGDLYYREALSFDRLYKWKEAKESYSKAISLKAYNLNWYYRLGFVQERLNDWNSAIKSYSLVAFHSSKHNPIYYYRLGYVLNKAQRYKDACESFLLMKNVKLDNSEEESLSLSSLESVVEEELSENIELLHNTLENNSTDTALWYALGNKADKLNAWEVAEYGYKEHLARKENFDANLYFLLGNVLAQQGKYKEACSIFLEQKITQLAHGTPLNNYETNQNFKRSIDYTEYYERFEIEENTILYESYHGSSISCNPYAIFKTIYQNEQFEGYRHIWVLDDKSKIPQDLKKYSNIIFVKRDSDLYMRYLSKSKYLINNVTFPEYFIRKEGQYYLNTWHGTPIKSLGKDVKESFMAHKNVSRNFLQASHILSPNNYTTKVLLDRYDVRNIFNGVVAEVGYPRQDLMLNISMEDKKTLIKELQIDTSKKIVLYAPTWRGMHGKSEFDTTRLEKDLSSLEKLEEIEILFRGHHMIEKLLGNLSINCRIVPASIDTNSLLSIVDVLITDYSSIAFDYMALARPIIYYTYDRKEYEEERGLYFPLEELGGEICNTREELMISIKEVVKDSTISSIQKKAQEKFCSYDDGGASIRVVDSFLRNRDINLNVPKRKYKKSILFYGGPFIPNGITSSFINLLNHIDYDKYSVTVIVEPNTTMNKHPERLEQISKIDKRISILGRVGGMNLRLEEDWIIKKFSSQKELTTDEMWNIFYKAYSREMNRMLGDNQFDYFVNFEGYNTFWVSLFSSKENNSIFLHSDIYEELKLRFPYLEQNIKLYSFYKNIVPVSETIMNVNIQKISTLFNIQEEKFIYCNNVQSPENILTKSKEEIEPRDKFIFNKSIVFINIARHSPEKDLEKLFRAFSIVVKKYPNVKLINLGSGPLENHLKHLILNLKLKKNIFLLGQKLNPYPYLDKSNCFILSSNHEGQPITLFESLILKKPIIATDIAGNRSILENRSGVLVENSIDGLANSIVDFIENGQEVKEFNYTSYNKETLNMFYKKILGD